MASREFRTISSFFLVGGIGFIVDASLLALLTHLSDWTPWSARIPSFLTAVLVTWSMNRNFTFAHRRTGSKGSEALGYALIQTGGALINLTIFGVCLHFIPRLHSIPVIALSIGAAGGFAFNYLLSDRLLYAR